MKRYLALFLALVLLLGAFPAQQADAATTTTATVKGGWLRLREGASYQSRTITSYYTGTVVNILGTSGAWYHVTTPDGRTGYMHGNYLTIGGQPTGNENIAATVVSSNGLGVRLRTGPSTAYGVIATYPVGTSATIISSGSYWHYVSINGRKGYMMSKFLSTSGGQTPVTPSGYTAYVTSKNGLGVCLRSGAGKGYAVRGVYSVGTEVTVLKHNKVWDYIRVGSRTGYMMNEFLTTTNTNKNITGVVLSNAKPVVGESLWASVLPAGANVTYEWMDDRGLLLSTGATYTIQNGDVGRKIRVRVTGSNGYTGSAVSSFAQVGSGTQQATTVIGVSLDNGAPYVGLTLTANISPASATATYIWMRDDGVQVGSARSYTVQAADIGHTLYCVATGTGSYSGTVTSSLTKAAVDNKPAEKQSITGRAVLPAAIMPGVELKPTVDVNCASVTYQWQVGGAVVSTGATLQVTADMAGKDIVLVVLPASDSGYTGQVQSNVCSVLQGDIATTTDL